jgi:hypothetical protein
MKYQGLALAGLKVIAKRKPLSELEKNQVWTAIMRLFEISWWTRGKNFITKS